MSKSWPFVIVFSLFFNTQIVVASELTCLERAASTAMARMVTVIREHNYQASYDARNNELLLNPDQCAHYMRTVVDHHVQWDFSFCLGQDHDPTFPEFISFGEVLSLVELSSDCSEYKNAHSRYLKLSEQMANNSLDSTLLCTQTFHLLLDYSTKCKKKAP